ncbi:Ribosome maturation factor rimM [uncultured Clostridium sp.]|uniref:Ribosome maturation factor RimM n=1 Tax=Paeniclostridium hominis TaxID=2764329 RepID=A0ABR7K439_9FIRM|nr:MULTISPECIES: ribosome maturation factor RimM [Paeniclostridium]MDU2592054.1 ribosome maturation factor RimM [Paeniclostridium sordellii]SCI75411.1 Ribosome maturation factor rimM [uncultured Clostridium sp.]MBC6003881.1 16S rRNA processing protein RimM [Paeniclostridium hominis]MBC8631124.1 16S rRNA processing protein RimM [[Eubacterium] tenue]SCJ10566.1 Ribosome maturation factor rimM [uncultured Clostridium sp.]
MENKLTHFKIGQIVKTQGLKGEVRVYSTTDDIYRFDDLNTFYIGKDFNTEYKVERVRYKGNLVIMKIKGIDTVEMAEKLRNKNVYVSREESRDLEEDEFFIADMIGIKVYTVNDEYVGTLDDVLQYSANDVYVIKGEDDKEYLIPAVMKFVPEIDIEEGKMIIDPIKGMLE